jgi:hypothetical protein
LTRAPNFAVPLSRSLSGFFVLVTLWKIDQLQLYASPTTVQFRPYDFAW